MDDATQALLDRTGARLVPLVLARRTPLSQDLLELEFVGPVGLLVDHAGSDLMVEVASEPIAHRRRYSIRSIDELQGRAVIWVDQSADGPGSQWSRTLPLGSTLTVIGPRGVVKLDELADWHLFVGDLTFLSASYAMAEAIEPPGQALFVFEVADPESIPLPTLDDEVAVTLITVDRAQRTTTDPSGLVTAIEAMEFPDLEGHAYLGGEYHVVKAVKEALIGRGLPEASIHAKAYWRSGAANLGHGEPPKDA